MGLIDYIDSSEHNGITVKLFEYNLTNDNNIIELKNYLIDKVKKSQSYTKKIISNLHYNTSPLMNDKFIANITKRINDCSCPQNHPIEHFGVKRERITEWMAQLLLEKKYKCKFFDEADKRMLLSYATEDKHTPGIDVPGILTNGDELKFIICEVKASEQNSIPCSSSKELNDDIQKAINNKKNRVSKEILDYVSRIQDIEFNTKDIEKIINFLLELLSDTTYNNKIHFFPVLIRNNEKIKINKNSDDYKNFNVDNLSKENIENILGIFLSPINEFSDSIYKEALNGE